MGDRQEQTDVAEGGGKALAMAIEVGDWKMQAGDRKMRDLAMGD